MPSATPEPIELANAILSDPEISDRALAVFGEWCEALVPTNEDEIKNKLVDKINSLNFSYTASRQDNRRVNGGQPDIWVYGKRDVACPFLLIEVMKKRASDRVWTDHVSREYESQSGLVMYTNGILFKVFYNGVKYCDFDFNDQRQRILFCALIKSVDQFASSKPSYPHVDLLTVEKKMAKVLSQLMRQSSEKTRLLVTYLISIGVLEHTGYLTTSHINSIASSGDPNRELQTLLEDRQRLPALEKLREDVRSHLHNIRGSEVCQSTLRCDDKIVSFRNLDAYSLSRIYEYVFSARERGSNGIYATPKSICLEIARKAYKDLTYNEPRLDRVINVAVADISCGSGNFLEAAITTLCESVEYGANHVGIERRQRYKFTIVGRDIHSEAVCFAEVASILALQRRHLNPVFAANPLDIEFKFDIGDGSNEEAVSELLKPYDYCLWLGNPPFVKQTRMANAVVAIRSGKKNLGTIFLETMLSVPQARKVIGIIYQMAFIGSQCQDAQFLADNQSLYLNHFIYFGSSRLFSNLAAQKWCALILSSSTDIRTYKKVAPINEPQELGSLDALVESYMARQPGQVLVDDLKLNTYKSFRMVTSHDRDLAEILLAIPAAGLQREQGIIPSSESFDNRPCFQVADSFRRLLSDSEKDLLKPYWNETYQNDFYIAGGTSYLIDIPKTRFSTRVLNIRESAEEKDARIVAMEQVFAVEAPIIYQHLVNFKHEISAMRGRTRPWWVLHRNRGGRICRKPKLIIPQMLNWSYPILAYIDNYGVGVPFNFNVILGRDEYRKHWQESLAGWLNSGAIAFYLNGMNGSKPRGAGGEMTGELLDALPIPDCVLYKSDSKSEKLVAELVVAVKKSEGKFAAERRSIQNSIDRICTEILRLEVVRQNKTKEISLLHREDWLKPA